MKHLKTFEGYLNEGETIEPINESTTFVSNEKFADEATLKADILKNAGPALVKFLGDKGIKWPGALTIEDKGNRIALSSKPITGNDLGLMQYGFKEVYLTFFNGGSFPKVNKSSETFEFEPSIWCNLNYSYVHTTGGSNGTNFVLPGDYDGSIWYDVVNGVWLDRKEAQKAGF